MACPFMIDASLVVFLGPLLLISCCRRVKYLFEQSGYGLVAMTFASHARGREFDPHYPYFDSLALCLDSSLKGPLELQTLCAARPWARNPALGADRLTSEWLAWPGLGLIACLPGLVGGALPSKGLCGRVRVSPEGGNTWKTSRCPG